MFLKRPAKMAKMQAETYRREWCWEDEECVVPSWYRRPRPLPCTRTGSTVCRSHRVNCVWHVRTAPPRLSQSTGEWSADAILRASSKRRPAGTSRYQSAGLRKLPSENPATWLLCSRLYWRTDSQLLTNFTSCSASLLTLSPRPQNHVLTAQWKASFTVTLGVIITWAKRDTHWSFEVSV